MCSYCKQIVDEIYMREGRAAGIAARERMEDACDRRCRCGKRIRCDATECGNCGEEVL